MISGTTGDFTAHPTTPSFGANNSQDVTLGDLDGNGALDAVVANHNGQAETVWLNDGAGNFTAHPTTPSFGGANSREVALGDLDGNGTLDAVVATTNAETVWLNDGAGNFSAHPTTPSFGAGSSNEVVLGDLDGNGTLDAVLANTAGQAETVWLNDGAGNFIAHPTTPNFGVGNSVGVVLGDLDGNGSLDAIVANTSGQAQTVWLNDGAGSFTAHPTTPSFGANNSFGITLGDLDGNRSLDAVVANHNNIAETVWLNDGSGNFTPHPTTPSFGAGNSMQVVLGDVDANTTLDAVVANHNGQAETVWLNDGGGNFTPHPTTPSFGVEDSRGLALGDLDGNGSLDAIIANQAGQAQTVWLNNNRVSVSVRSNLAVVTITVMGVDEPPMAVPDWYTTTGNFPLVVPAGSGLLANDVETDGDVLTATVLIPPAMGALSLVSDGSFAYTPTLGIGGVYTFSYEVSDGFFVDTAFVTLTIISTPPIAVPDWYTLTRNMPPFVVSVGSGVLANDVETDGDVLTATVLTPPAMGVLVSGC